MAVRALYARDVDIQAALNDIFGTAPNHAPVLGDADSNLCAGYLSPLVRHTGRRTLEVRTGTFLLIDGTCANC
jgi:hypothetical protein